MANEEQLAILKQGYDAWNTWWSEQGLRRFDTIDLSGASLNKVNLSGFLLDGADLSSADLSEADLSFAVLRGVNLWAANLEDAFLIHADLREADLSGVNFLNSNLGQAIMGGNTLAKIDFSKTYDLHSVIHEYSSTVGTDTIRLSKGKIPAVFLRGCGLSDWEIESAKLYNPNLTNDEIVKIQYRIYELRATQALQISPLFISYSHQDKPFVDKMDTVLTEKGVRFWRDIHDATAGRLETQIDRAIRQNPTVLLVLSKNSIKSDWVEHEVRTARELEKELGRDALCPIALDDSWKSSPWPKRVIEQVMEYNILDFSKWENESTFEEKFIKLLNGLDLFYKKPASQ